MTNHCAVTCPIVTEAVEAASQESKIRMAMAAIESEKISESAAAQRFGVPRRTLNRRVGAGQLASIDTPKEFTHSDGRVHAAGSSSMLVLLT
jgi:DNA-binding NtrC family response regulator